MTNLPDKGESVDRLPRSGVQGLARGSLRNTPVGKEVTDKTELSRGLPLKGYKPRPQGELRTRKYPSVGQGLT